MIGVVIETRDVKLRLQQEFTRLQQQQQTARQQRQSDTLAGHVLELREESLVSAQHCVLGKTPRHCSLVAATCGAKRLH